VKQSGRILDAFSHYEGKNRRISEVEIYINTLEKKDIKMGRARFELATHGFSVI